MGRSRKARAHAHRGNRKQTARENRRAVRDARTPAFEIARRHIGGVFWATCDINANAERGANRDGTDRHETKIRPVVVIASRPGFVHVIPFTTQATDLSLHDRVVGLTQHAASDAGDAGQYLMRRLVAVPVDQIRFAAFAHCGDVSSKDLARLHDELRSGTIEDLTDQPAATITAPGPSRVRAVMRADDALNELRRRRRAIIAAHDTEGQATTAS